MKKYFYIILLISCVNVYAAPGDDCATAITVSSNGCSATGAYDNTGITGTLAAPSCFTGGTNNGMWFRFVATTRIVNATVNGGTLIQPQIALLDPGTTGCTGPFTELVCNSSVSATSSINYSNLTIGNTYIIYVDGQNNGTGNFQLCLTSPVAPSNDNPCNPIVVPANNFCSGANAYTNIGAGSENLFSSTYPGCWSATGAFNTVYFRFTALGPFNTITVSGNLNKPQITVIQTPNCNGNTWSNNGASSCAAGAGTTATMNANNLTAGQTYLIAVDGSIDNVGTFQLCVNSYTPTVGVPANDQCSGATPLCPSQFVSGTTVNATATNDIPIGRWTCNGVLDNPVWFSFVANTPVQPVVLNMNGACNANVLQVEVFRFTGASNPCAPANNNQYTSIGCNNSISNGSATLTIPAANMVAGQTYYILADNWPGNTCNFNFTITGNAGANAGADQDICISQAPFNLTGIPAGGTWSGPGITNAATGTFSPQAAGFGTHYMYYSNGACNDEKIINVTGPQVVTSNDVSICGGSTQLAGSVNLYPTSIVKAFTNTTDYGIPDNNGTGIASVVAVAGINPSTVATNPIQKVCMNINHPFDGDLDVFLICPGGTQIELTTDNGGGGDNYTNTCFVASGTSITAGTSPFTGNFTPEQAFTNLNGCNINGNWTLRVIDDAGGDVGTLRDWSIYFNNANNVNYAWSPTANMTGSTTLSPTVTPTASTTYFLTATDVNGCIAVDSMRVTIGNSIAGPDQSICKNTSTSFASSGTGSWTPLPSNPAVVTIQTASNPTSNVGPFSTVGTYNFEWNTGSCRDTVKIVVNALPVADAGIDKTITCSIPSTVIGTSAVAGINYTWSPAAGLSATNIAQPTASQAGTYTVTATNPTTTCFSTDQVVITLNGTLPVADAGIDKILTCSVTSIQIGTAAIAGNTYAWSPAAGLSATNIAQPTATAPGTYTVTVTNTANGCTATDAVNVTKNITPPVANAGVDQTLTCTNPSLSIGAAAIAGNTYSWSPAAGLSASNIAQPNATAPGTYTLTVTNTANGCTATDAVVISQNITPPVANAGTDKTLTCSVTSIQIGTTAVAGNTYAWSPAAGLSVSTIAQPNATAPGTYTLTVTNTANGCTATDAVVISQNITPPVANAGTDKTLTCSVTSIQIGTAAVAGNTYAWSPAAGLSTSNIAQPNATAPGTYTVTVTNTSNGCTATDAVTVSQNITPPVANAGVDKTLTCTTTTVSIGAAAVAGNTYAWSPAAGLSVSTIAQPNATAPGTYTLTVTNTANGCTATDAVVISQNINPPAANAGTDKTLTCSVPSIQIGTAAIAGNTYSWSPAANLSASNIAQPNATAPGTYTLTVTNTANGCTATDAVVISQNIMPPAANAGTDKSLTCSVTSIQIGTAAIAGNTYAWSPAAGLSASNIAQPNATAPGNYTVTVTNTANGCTATDAVTISQNITPPIANAGTDKTLTCVTTSVSIGASAVAGNTYAWSPAAGLSVSTIAQPNATAPGTYTLTVTNTANGCTATDAVVISQNIAPPISNAGTDKNLTCTVTSFVIGTAAIAGNSYSWSPAAGLSASNIAQPNVTVPGTYTLTVTNSANGCTATDAVVISQNITPPAANAGTDKTLTCSVTSVQIGTVAIAGNTYAWSPAAGLSASNIAQPNATAPGNYTVTVTNTANGCTATDAVVISQNITPPVANAGTDKTLTCSVTSIQIGTAAVAGNTYAWSPAAGLSASNIAQPNATAPGTYTLTVTNTANGCIATDAVVISQNITPPAANAGTDKTLTCVTTSVSIGSAAVAGNTYSWSPAAGLSATNIAQPNATAPGTYTLTVTNTINGCTATDAVNVLQDITAPIADAGIDKTLTCSTTSVPVGSLAVAGNTYAWSPAAGLTNTAIAQPFANLPGTYFLTVTNIADGCITKDSVIISQNITPPIANTGTNQTLTCTTTSVSIGTAAVVGNTYSWLPAAGLSNATIAQPTSTLPNTYTLTVTNTANGCTATDAATILQNITPPVANAGANQTLTCATTSVSIGTASVSGNTYSWSPAAGLSASNIAQPNATAPGTYTLTVTNTANGCTAVNSMTVLENITTTSAIAGNDNTLTCTNTNLLIGAPFISGNTYSWSPVSGLSNSSIAQPTVTLPGLYKLTVTNIASGCTSNDEINIGIDTIHPISDAGEDKTITCTVTSFTIGSLPASGIKYNWTPTAGLTSSTIAQPIASLPGTYILTTTNPNNGCSSTDQMTISVNTPYTDIDLGDDITIYQEESTVLTSAGSPLGNYIWTPTNTLSCGSCASPVASPLTTTTYYLTFTNPEKCVSLDTITIKVIPVIGLFFPNAFTPNMDGYNDYFTALGDSVKSYELNIYNRWGELLFTTNDISVGWDGIYKGERQQQDSYVYTAHAVLYNNKKKDYKGIVTLFK